MPKARYDQLRVIANQNEGLYVLDAKGNRVQVFGCNIMLKAGKPPVMQLNLLAQPFNVEGVPTFMAQDPLDGQLKAVRRIEWADGTVAEFPVPTPQQEPAAADQVQGAAPGGEVAEHDQAAPATDPPPGST